MAEHTKQRVYFAPSGQEIKIKIRRLGEEFLRRNKKGS
jgi:hypothetical protein